MVIVIDSLTCRAHAPLETSWLRTIVIIDSDTPRTRPTNTFTHRRQQLHGRDHRRGHAPAPLRQGPRDGQPRGLPCQGIYIHLHTYTGPSVQTTPQIGPTPCTPRQLPQRPTPQIASDSGIAQWKVSLGDAASPVLHLAVDPTNHQHIYAAGVFNSSAVRTLAGTGTVEQIGHPTLLRVDAATGRLLWATRGVPNPTAIAMDFLGFVYLTGSFTSSLIGLPSTTRPTALTPSDIYLVKLDPRHPANANGALGAVAFARGFNGGTSAGRYAPTDVAVDLQGSVYLTGTYIGAPLNLAAGTTALASPGSSATDGFAGRVLVVSLLQKKWWRLCMCGWMSIYPDDKRPPDADSLPLFILHPHNPPRNPTASALHPRAHGPAHAAPAHAQPLPSAHPGALRRPGPSDAGPLHGPRADHGRRGDRPHHRHDGAAHGGDHHDVGPDAGAVPPARRRDAAADDAGGRRETICEGKDAPCVL